MKPIIKITTCMIAVMCLCTASHAQYLRGLYGAFQPAMQTTMNCYSHTGIAKTANYDTLINADTGYVWVYEPIRYDMTYDLLSTVLTGTVSTTANVLQGCNDSSTLTANWTNLTGVTTTCASCVGSSSTTTPTMGGTHYYWQLPAGLGDNWKYYRIRVIQTGTCTATYAGTVTQKW